MWQAEKKEKEERRARAEELKTAKRQVAIGKAKARAKRRKELEKDQKRQFTTEAGTALLDFMFMNPFLAKNSHELHEWIMECKAELLKGNEAQAMDIVARMKAHRFNEDGVLRAAFDLFDISGDKGSLNFVEVQSMLQYLGFPSADDEVKKLLDVIDK